jgi:hypothetical protein
MEKKLRKLGRILSALNWGHAVPMLLEEKLWRLENDVAWTTIELPIDTDGLAIAAIEEIIVEKVGDNRFRLASSPGMVRGLAAHDVIALNAENAAGFELVQRGQNVCIHLFCDTAQRAQIQAGLSQTLGRLGGWLDATMGGTGLCFTVPVAAGFSAIERALRQVVGEDWEYSNVLDPETDAPLNWWLQ